MPSGLCRLVVSVCLSVRPSDTLVYCIETSKHILKLFLQSSRPTISVFPYQTLWQIFCGNPLRGRRVQLRYEKTCDFRPMARFISEVIQDTAIVTIYRMVLFPWTTVTRHLTLYSVSRGRCIEANEDGPQKHIPRSVDFADVPNVQLQGSRSVYTYSNFWSIRTYDNVFYFSVRKQ